MKTAPGAVHGGRHCRTSDVDESLELPPLRRPNVLWIFGDQHRAQATGYHTACVGKWHLDGTNDLDHYVPPKRRGG